LFRQKPDKGQVTFARVKTAIALQHFHRFKYRLVTKRGEVSGTIPRNRSNRVPMAARAARRIRQRLLVTLSVTHSKTLPGRHCTCSSSCSPRSRSSSRRCSFKIFFFLVFYKSCFRLKVGLRKMHLSHSRRYKMWLTVYLAQL
jgi:hypothetical protein